MWYCYTIERNTGFKQLSVITKDLQEIYDFIAEVKAIDAEGFKFEIKEEKLLDKHFCF